MTDREARRDAERVEHILEAAAKLAEIVAEGREAFDTSWRLRDIAERRLEIIGEAAGHLSARFVAAHPDLGIAGARRMRDFIAHSYFKVDPDLVWDAITVSVPDLAATLRAYPDVAGPGVGGEPPALGA
ncbi:MAG: DUF86 domain-containing protein [bacterium]|nr:DUF86 domain-containing protein [bacterium]MCY4102850.1 DUF86 domain-containing protein [bacterium]